MLNGSASFIASDSQIILLLDDDRMITESLAAALERDGRAIITCNDVESAELILERFRPAYVVSDVHMSGPFRFEGLDLIEYAKRHSPETQVILISGNGRDAVKQEGVQRGAVAFLNKPFEVRELDAMLNVISPFALPSTRALAKVIRMPLLDEILLSESLNPFFQPVVSLDHPGRLGYESLARYRSDSPLRNPEVLFTYAVRKHRLADLEFDCISRSLKAGAELSESGLLFLNIHPEVFNTGERLYQTLAAGARESKVPLDRIVLEITEQAPLVETPGVLNTITQLQRLGIRFAFDDLGVAYSPLALIDRIRPAFLKVSQHFGTDFETNRTKTKIIANIQSLAHDFKCDVILEGIESQATAQAAADLGIPYGQGYFFGSPADAAVFRESGSGSRVVRAFEAGSDEL